MKGVKSGIINRALCLEVLYLLLFSTKIAQNVQVC